jgi:hypothetical protein
VNDAAYKGLRTNVIRKFGRPLKSQQDLQMLRDDIVVITGQSIGFNTLRRCFGFLSETRPNSRTLSTLSQYVGFQDFNSFSREAGLDAGWRAWNQINIIAVEDEIREEDLAVIRGLKSTQSDYYLLLGFVIVQCIAQGNQAKLVRLFSEATLFEIDLGLRIRIASIVGVHMRRSYGEFDLLELARLPLYRELIAGYFVDYKSLNGGFRQLLEAMLTLDIGSDENLFCQLLLGYRALLSGEKFERVQGEVTRNTSPTLAGRFFGFRFLQSEAREIDEISLEIVAFAAHSNNLLLFFLEVFPALILKRRLDLISKVIDQYYEELFDATEWQHRCEETTYFLGKAFVEISRSDYRSAEISLSFIEMSEVVDSYRDYLNLFYLMAQYEMQRNKNCPPQVLNRIANEYAHTVRVTGFLLFDDKMLTEYFSS